MPHETPLLLLTGAGGMLARAIHRQWKRGGRGSGVRLLGLNRRKLDITCPSATHEVVRDLRPTVLINAAAYTRVDDAEQDVAGATAVNATGPALLAEACRRYACRLIHISTDYVFDGRRREPYLPSDPINPLNEYGRSKAEGEIHIRRTLPDHLILRTSWLFGIEGTNFVKTILRLACERDRIDVVADQVSRPTYADDLADLILRVATTETVGTYHACNTGPCSWYDLAKEIVRQYRLPLEVRPTTTAAFPRPAPRPAYSVLDTTATESCWGRSLRPWPEALSDCIRQIKAIGDETRTTSVSGLMIGQGS